MRTQYKCTCDSCKKDIETANEENDVSLNSAKYVLCDSCFAKFTSVLESLNLT